MLNFLKGLVKVAQSINAIGKINSNSDSSNSPSSVGNWYPAISSGYSKNTKQNITCETALLNNAVWCAESFLAESISSCPIRLFKKGNNSKDNTEVTDYQGLFVLQHPHYFVDDYPQLTSTALREFATRNQVSDGNGFINIVRDENEIPLALYPVHQSRVRPVRPEENQPNYSYKVLNDVGLPTYLQAKDLIHFCGRLTVDGIWGRSTLNYGKDTIGFGRLLDKHGQTYIASGGQTKAAVFLPGLKTKETQTAFREQWKSVHGSPDAHEIVIMPPEGRYEPASYNAEQNQYVETKRLTIADVARLYRIPLHTLYELVEGKPSYASLAAIGTDLITYSFLPWILKQEEQLNLKMLPPEMRLTHFFKYDLNVFQVGDRNSRKDSAVKAIMSGLSTINEERYEDGKNSIGPMGDETLIANNLTTLEKLLDDNNVDQTADSSTNDTNGNAVDDSTGNPGKDSGGDGNSDNPSGDTADQSKQSKCRVDSRSKCNL